MTKHFSILNTNEFGFSIFRCSKGLYSLTSLKSCCKSIKCFSCNKNGFLYQLFCSIVTNTERSVHFKSPPATEPLSFRKAHEQYSMAMHSNLRLITFPFHNATFNKNQSLMEHMFAPGHKRQKMSRHLSQLQSIDDSATPSEAIRYEWSIKVAQIVSSPMEGSPKAHAKTCLGFAHDT